MRVLGWDRATVNLASKSEAIGCSMKGVACIRWQERRGRSPSTISREVARAGGHHSYDAASAQRMKPSPKAGLMATAEPIRPRAPYATSFSLRTRVSCGHWTRSAKLRREAGPPSLAATPWAQCSPRVLWRREPDIRQGWVVPVRGEIARRKNAVDHETERVTRPCSAVA